MSKVLLIANGPSAIEKKLGNRIDSDEFDKVIRFNRWKFKEDGSEHKGDHSEFVGTRCDYWLVSDKYIPLTPNRSSLYKEIFVNIPKFG